MMKKILFVLNNLRVGGAEKALIALLHEMDFSRYEIDVFLFSHDGNFLKRLPEQVNLLPAPKNFKYFDRYITCRNHCDDFCINTTNINNYDILLCSDWCLWYPCYSKNHRTYKTGDSQ